MPPQSHRIAPHQAGPSLPEARAPYVSSRNRSAAVTVEDEGFYPVLGIVGTVVGTTIAIASVPSNPRKEGVLLIAGLAMCLGLAAAPMAAFFSNFRNILRTENIIGMAGIYWLFMDLITAVYDLPMVDRTAVRMSFASSGLFVVMFWVGTMRKPWKLPKVFVASCSFRPEVSIIFPIICICFVLGMLSYAIPSGFDVGLMFRSLLNNRWMAPWSRGSLGGWEAFVDHLCYFGYLLPTLSIMLVRRKGWFHPACVAAIILSCIFLAFLMHSGARRIIGVCLGSALTYWVLDRERVRLWQLATAAAIIVFILFTMQFMLVFRTLGLGQVGASRSAAIAWDSIQGEGKAVGGPKGLAVDDNFYRLAQIHSIVPEHHDFVYWRHLWYIIVRPIPRVFWEGKPVDGGFSLMDFDNSGASLTISIVGEAWISWGFPAVAAFGWLFGRLSRLNSPLFRASSGSIGPMFYGYMTMILFVGWRALAEVLLFSYALLGWIFATWLFSKIRSDMFRQP